MKKIWIQLFIVIIGIILCIIGHNGVKKYIYKNFINKETVKELAYNNNLNISNNPKIIYTNVESVISKEETTTTQTTTKPLPTTTTTIKTTTKTTIPTTEKLLEEKKEEEKIELNIEESNEKIFDNMTLSELTEKLNKSLNSTLSNTGHYFANYYVKTGLDPYLAVAIVLHETGCKWTCSKLVRECNNIGGMKAKPGCNGGNYKKYDTLESGINGYLDMLYNNYYSQGLTTPELINPKYAASTTWSEKINSYILEIKEK